MKQVWIYDVECERLDELENETETTTPRLIEAILDLLEDEFKDREVLIDKLNQYL